MRYRDVNTIDTINFDLAEIHFLLGEEIYRDLLTNLGKGLNVKGYVTPIDDMIYSLELQLLNIELSRAASDGKLKSLSAEFHEAIDFIIGVGQTIPAISTSAKAKVRGKIISGLRTHGLRSLQHEFRVACKLSNIGCDVFFDDFEGRSRYDLRAERGSIQYEIEVKSLSAFSGQTISPIDADKFFVELRRNLQTNSTDCDAVVIEIVLSSQISKKRPDLERLVASCNEAAKTRGKVDIEGNSHARYVTSISTSVFDKFRAVAKLPFRFGQYTYIIDDHRKAVVKLSSKRGDKFRKNVLYSIKEAYNQLSHKLLGIVWIHIDFITVEEFAALDKFFTSIAEEIFGSPRAEYLSQLVFSGGANLETTSNEARSSFSTTIFNSPSSDTKVSLLLPGGRVRRVA